MAQTEQTPVTPEKGEDMKLKAPPSAVPEDAIEFLSDAEEIEQKPYPRSSQITLYLLVGFLLTALAWSTFAKIDRMVIARGKLVSRVATIVIQPFVTSVVRNVHVRSGQAVRKGDLLITFDQTFAATDQEDWGQRTETLYARLQRVEAELQGNENMQGDETDSFRAEKRLFSERRDHYKARLVFFNEDLKRLQASLGAAVGQEEILNKRFASAKELEGMRAELLEKGSGSKLMLLLAQEKRLAVEEDFQALNDRRIETSHKITSLRAETRVFILKWRQDLVDELTKTRAQLDSTLGRLRKAEWLKQLVNIYAPTDAVVLEVTDLSLGSVVREAQTIMTLVPANAVLEAEVQIEPKDIGYLRIGDEVRIKLDAFPYQKHGIVTGSLQTVSEDALTEQASSPGSAERTYFKGGVDINRDDNAFQIPKGARLQPGMSLSAEIVVGKRRVISYFFYPIFRALDESIREP